MVNWRGEEVTEKVLLKAGTAMDSVMADCVARAKEKVRRQTTLLQGGIQYRATRKMRPGVLIGYWGAFNILYALYVELGTAPHWPPVDAIRRSMRLKTMEEAWPIARAIAERGTKPHPYLRPAADEFYPDLKRRIKVG